MRAKLFRIGDQTEFWVIPEEIKGKRIDDPAVLAWISRDEHDEIISYLILREDNEEYDWPFDPRLQTAEQAEAHFIAALPALKQHGYTFDVNSGQMLTRKEQDHICQ